MDRRTFGTSMLLGAFGVAAAPAVAQGRRRPMAGMMPMGPAEMRHVRETLQIGAVALQSSELALDRASDDDVRRFATAEVDEQRGVAMILREISGMAPPPPGPADRAALQRLQGARGEAFERDYIAAQLDGHDRLLRVQDQYLAQGRNQHHRHIAMLAASRIREHIADLRDLRDDAR